MLTSILFINKTQKNITLSNSESVTPLMIKLDNNDKQENILDSINISEYNVESKKYFSRKNYLVFIYNRLFNQKKIGQVPYD